jgi:hypothetical protein
LPLTYAFLGCGPLQGRIQTSEDVKKKTSFWLSPHEVKPDGFVDHFRLIRNFLSSSNGCELVKNAHSFVKLRKHLCFCLFIQQRKIFSSNKTTAIPKQLQNASKKDSDLRLLQKIKNGISDVLKGAGLKFRIH